MSGIKKILFVNTQGKTWLQAVYRLPDEGLMRKLGLPPRVINTYRERGRAEAGQRLATLCGYSGNLVRSSSAFVCRGRLEHVLDGYARHGDAGLIVIGKRSRHAMAWPGMGSGVARLVDRACCEVLAGAVDEGADSGRRLAGARLAALGETSCGNRRPVLAAAKEN